MKLFKLTDKQRQALGEVMADTFGGHVQTGIEPEQENCVYVYWNMGPHLPTKKAIIDEEGTVTYAMIDLKMN